MQKSAQGVLKNWLQRRSTRCTFAHLCFKRKCL